MPRHCHRSHWVANGERFNGFLVRKVQKMLQFRRISYAFQPLFVLHPVQVAFPMKQKSFGAHNSNEITFWHFYYYSNVFERDFSIVDVLDVVVVIFFFLRQLLISTSDETFNHHIFTSLPRNGMWIVNVQEGGRTERRRKLKPMAATNRLKWFDSNV